MSASIAPAVLSIQASSAGARSASEWLEAEASARGVPSEQLLRLDHCLDEALANVVAHGGAAARASLVIVHLEVHGGPDGGVAAVTISDSGAAFDPLPILSTPRATPASLADATPGGLGLQMIRTHSDIVGYRYEDGRNHLTFSVRWGHADSMVPNPASRVPLPGAHSVGPEAIALFRGADPAVVAEAIRDCEIRSLPAGAPLMRPGDANDSIFVLLSGNMVAYLDDALLPANAISILPGESVGEMSAVDGQPVSALVVAVTDVQLLVLPDAVFWSRLGPIPGISRNLLGLLAGRMRRSNESMLEAQRKQFALEYLRKELEIARQLQAGMIPLPGRLFPERADVEVAGFMEPAAEIGGDFFDAFFVDDHCLFVCVGDVSGHGIPAALFMARTVGLIRIAAVGTRSPDRLLERINEQLCSGNDASLFVTLFCGFLDVLTGRLVYANAGHCAPLVAGGGKSSWLPIPKGALAGAMPGLRYTAAEVLLEEGVALVCYTDGVTEAEVATGGEFSEARLLALSATNAHLPVDGLLDALRCALAAAIGAAALSDDCTLLAVRRHASR